MSQATVEAQPATFPKFNQTLTTGTGAEHVPALAHRRAVLDGLIWSSLWLRDVPGGIRAVIAAYMLRLVVSGSTPVRLVPARQ